MCFLSLLAAHDGWINTAANTGNFHSHIFTHALSVSFFSFQVYFHRTDENHLWEKAIRAQQDIHVFQATEENTMGDGALFSAIFRLRGYVITR